MHGQLIYTQSQEGGYGKMPFCEAHGELVLLICWLEWPDISAAGGTTYLAIAALHLIPDKQRTGADVLTPPERAQTVRWLVQNQELSGGFRGRTEKEADACYCFWCGAALEVRFMGCAFIQPSTGLDFGHEGASQRACPFAIHSRLPI